MIMIVKTHVVDTNSVDLISEIPNHFVYTNICFMQTQIGDVSTHGTVAEIANFMQKLTYVPFLPKSGTIPKTGCFTSDVRHEI